MQKLFFLYFSYFILALFMGIIVYVTTIAYSRRSGSTGMDMASIQKVRYETVIKEANKGGHP